MHDDLSLLYDLVLVLGAALVVVLAVAKVHLPSIAGFILAGVLIGPHAIGLVRDPHAVHLLAEDHRGGYQRGGAGTSGEPHVRLLGLCRLVLGNLSIDSPPTQRSPPLRARVPYMR
jgi:hypothetical protein